jgi:hypothetical protein
VGKEELPRGGVIELAPIVALDTLHLAEVLTKEKIEWKSKSSTKNHQE